jgi:hypothetical protein
MSASAPRSSSLLALSLVAAAGCVIDETSHERTTSLRVTVTAPGDLGSEATRLSDETREVSFSVQAIGRQGQPDLHFHAPVDVYVHTLGDLTSTATRVELRGGAGAGTITMPLSFGKTFLWIEDVTDTELRQATYATGTSPILWYREPFLTDISTPDPRGSVSSQLRFSRLTGKQVRVTGSRHGAAGRLLVTAVYADGYGVSDVRYGQPSVSEPYGHVFVYSFGRPIDIRGRSVHVGQTLKWVEGGVVEFNGFTELNFPSQEIDDLMGDPSFLPEPVLIDREWLRSGANQNLLKMEEQESGLMRIENAIVCSLDTDYERFKQWKVNIGLGCGTAVNVITASQITSFDPAAYVGKTIPRITGMLRAVNLGSLNVWILLPRSASDLVLP